MGISFLFSFVFRFNWKLSFRVRRCALYLLTVSLILITFFKADSLKSILHKGKPAQIRYTCLYFSIQSPTINWNSAGPKENSFSGSKLLLTLSQWHSPTFCYITCRLRELKIRQVFALECCPPSPIKQHPQNPPSPNYYSFISWKLKFRLSYRWAVPNY